MKLVRCAHVGAVACGDLGDDHITPLAANLKPSSAGPMQPGAVVEVEIEHIGCLRNTIAAPR